MGLRKQPSSVPALPVPTLHSLLLEVSYICIALHVHRIAACGALGSFLRL